MTRIWTSELPAHVGQRVRVAGWLHHQRKLSRLTFLLLRDARGVVQVILDGEELIAAAEPLQPETVLEIEALVIASEQAPGRLELRKPALRVIADSAGIPPVELRRPELKEQLPTLLDHAAVALRHPRRRAIARVTAATVAGYREALDRPGFTEIHSRS